MRKLTVEEIKKFSGRVGVRSWAVENFLATMGTDENVAWANLSLDKRLYKWDAKTVKAIKDGIKYACRKERNLEDYFRV